MKHTYMKRGRYEEELLFAVRLIVFVLALIGILIALNQ